jgi:hypothetical protein
MHAHYISFAKVKIQCRLHYIKWLKSIYSLDGIARSDATAYSMYIFLDFNFKKTFTHPFGIVSCYFFCFLYINLGKTQGIEEEKKLATDITS